MLGNNRIQVLHCGIYCVTIRDNYITGYKCVYNNVQVIVFNPTLLIIGIFSYKLLDLISQFYVL